MDTKLGEFSVHLWPGGTGRTYLTLLGLLILGSPTSLLGQDASVESVTWMSGCWVAKSGLSLTEEVWLQPRGGLMLGTSRGIREGIAVGYEFMRLHVQAGQLTYSAYPSGQAPADFVATYVGPDVVRFENPAHDFPQKIEYRAAHPDSLLASVFAETDDDEPSFEVRYARESCGF